MPNANEYMLKQADAEAIYQKKLNAGTGINIDPITDTISATGSGGSTVTYTPNITTGMILGVLGINGSSSPIKSPSLIAGQNISITQDPTTGALTFSSANATYNDMIGADGTNPGTHGLAPAPAATDNTKFLKGDGTWGDPVTPNPSGTATATLSKLSINNTVYNLAGGTTTYFGTTDPSNSVGNNGDLYFKYISTPITVEKEITLPTIPYGQNTYNEINDFSSYTDFTFTYTDVYGASLEKTVNISDIPESNDPLNGSRYEVYTFNSWLYLFVGKDSNGLWVVRGENCSFTKLVGTYAGAQIDITKAYVKIDDEWIEQPSGSGTEVIPNPSGSATATLSKLQIDNTIYGISGGGGGASVSELTQSQYNALTPAEKTNGLIYMTHDGGESIDQAVRMTSYTSISGTVSSTGDMGGFVPWYAFATEDTYDANQYGGYWATNTVGSYLQFDFVSPIDLMGVGFACYTTTTWKILSSTDGTTYTEVQQITQTQEDTTPTKIDYVLNSVASNCTSVRFVWVSGSVGGIGAVHLYGRAAGQSFPNRIYYNNTLYADNAAGGSSSGASIIGLSMSEYGALTPAEKHDEDKLYMVETDEDITPLYMADITKYQQSNVEITTTQDTTTLTWTSGSSIGQTFYYTTPIDLTDVDKIRYTIVTGGCFNTDSGWSPNPIRDLGIGVRDTAPSGVVLINSMNFTVYNEYKDTDVNSTFIDEELDVSGLSGNYYLIGTAAGWNAVITNIVLVNSIEQERRIYWDDKNWSGRNEGSENSSIPLFDGTWQNQDIMEITPYLATIEDGKLHCQGMHCGIVVSDVSGMTWSGSYKVIIEVESSNGFSFQIGQCTPTSDLDGIIRAGTNRITYTNDSITDGEHYILKANAIDATRGIFLGGYYLDSSINYDITKISLEYNNEKEYT